MDSIVGVFEALGLSPLEERIYNSLIDRPRSTSRELSEQLGLTSAQVQRGLTLLRQRGFVTETATRPREYMPSPPEAAVEVLVHRREEELHQARLAAAQLAERAREALEKVRTSDLLEILTGPEPIARRFRQLRQGTRRECLCIDRPPYVDPPDPEHVAEVKELLQRGVDFRMIYSKEALEMPERLSAVREMTTAGLDARILPDVETKLLIVDRRVGLIPLNLERRGVEDTVVVHASFLLSALTILFEALWREATPLSWHLGEAPQEQDAPRDELLRLAAAGLKDDSIARVLGQSRRTVVRRMTQVMVQLGAKTRFQAGVLAERTLKLGE